MHLLYYLHPPYFISFILFSPIQLYYLASYLKFISQHKTISIHMYIHNENE